jgi:hypothetical protein
MNTETYPNKFFKGYPHLHDKEFFNASMMRMIDWGGGDLQDIKKVAHRITDLPTWVKTMTELGDAAMSENRIGNAIAYYRWVEIYTLWGDPIYQLDNLKNKINVSELPQGIYFVKIETDKGVVTRKIVKE